MGLAEGDFRNLKLRFYNDAAKVLFGERELEFVVPHGRNIVDERLHIQRASREWNVRPAGIEKPRRYLHGNLHHAGVGMVFRIKAAQSAGGNVRLACVEHSSAKAGGVVIGHRGRLLKYEVGKAFSFYRGTRIASQQKC